jgi:choline-sulfatase
MVSYIDDQVGALMRVLSETGLADNTVIIVTSDHGDMLGERGLWYKMNFFENSARIPLIVHLPNRFTPRRVSLNVSLVDLFPTLLELSAGGEPVPNPVVALDGRSLLPLMLGDEGAWPDTAYGEYLAEGTTQPILMIKAGHHKYIRCNGDLPQLFDLSKDPLERRNLAGTSEHADTETRLAVKAEEHWNTKELREQVLKSQRSRLLLHSALMRGQPTPWDHQPIRIASKLYNRNHAGELYDTDRQARIPYRSSAPLRSF